MRHCAGLTFVEVLAATAVFGIVVFVLTGFYLTASSRGLLGRSETASALLAQQRLEFVRTRGYASLPGLAATETVDELGNATPTGQFTRTTSVVTPYLGTSNLTRVDVAVSWVEMGNPRSITLTTVVVNF